MSSDFCCPLPRSADPARMARRLAALLSADVQGYSRLMSDNEEATIRTLTTYREVMTRLIQHHRGRVVDAPGDNLLAEFVSVVDAVECAVRLQRTLAARNAELPAHRSMPFRMGINLGDVVVDGERLYGDDVNLTARLERLAEGGGICISGAVYDQIATKLALHYVYLGERKVKNLPKPIRVYRVQEPREEGGFPRPLWWLQALAALRRPRHLAIALVCLGIVAIILGYVLAHRYP